MSVIPEKINEETERRSPEWCKSRGGNGSGKMDGGQRTIQSPRSRFYIKVRAVLTGEGILSQ